MTETFKEIFSQVKGLEIIDTHEHLPYCESAREKDTDVLKEYLTHYFDRDLISAGLGIDDYEKVINNKLSLIDRWNLVEPHWEVDRYTGYGRALDISVKGLCGYQYLVRVNVSKALARKVKEGVFDLEKAKEISEMLFYQNPLNIFKLEDKIQVKRKNFG